VVAVEQRVLRTSLEYSDGDDLIQSGTTAEETGYDGAAERTFEALAGCPGARGVRVTLWNI